MSAQQPDGDRAVHDIVDACDTQGSLKATRQGKIITQDLCCACLQEHPMLPDKSESWLAEAAPPSTVNTRTPS